MTLNDDIGCALLLSAAVVAAALQAHWILRRLGRRLPRFLARRRSDTAAVRMSLESTVLLVLLPAKIALWFGVALFVSQRFAPLRQLRTMAVELVHMAATAPLFVLQGHVYSPVDVIELPIALAALWFGVGLLTHLLKTKVLGVTSMERGVQHAVALLIRYAMVFLGAI